MTEEDQYSEAIDLTRRVEFNADACDCGTPAGYHTSDCAGFKEAKS